MANASTKSLLSKRSLEELSNNLKLRWKLFKRKYANATGVKHILIRLVMYVLILGLAFVFLYPFLFMIIRSLMTDADLNSSTVRWLPTEIKFENYALAIQIMNAVKYAWNSTVVTVLATLGHIFACSFIGYGFARFNFPFKKLLFGFVMLSFIVPVQTLIVPMYITYTNWGWINTYLPFIATTLVGFGLKGALYVFLFRQFFLTVPRSLEEAARIDGCGFMKTYWKIVFPLAKSTLVVATVLSVVWQWNEFYEAGLYIESPSKVFLPPKLNLIINTANELPDQQAEMLRSLGLDDGEDILNDAVVLSGAVLISSPVLIFFAFAQRQFMEGIERTGITGE